MTPLHPSQIKRRQISEPDAAQPHSEKPTLTGMEELYWFAMELTGDPDLAAQLVVDATNISSNDRGIFRD